MFCPRLWVTGMIPSSAQVFLAELSGEEQQPADPCAVSHETHAMNSPASSVSSLKMSLPALGALLPRVCGGAGAAETACYF